VTPQALAPRATEPPDPARDPLAAALNWCIDYIEGTRDRTRPPLAEPFLSETLTRYRAIQGASSIGYHGDGEFDLHYDPHCVFCGTNRDRLRPDVGWDHIYAEADHD